MTNTPEDLYFKDADSTAQLGAGNYMAQPGMMAPVEPPGASRGPRNAVLAIVGIAVAVAVVGVGAVIAFMSFAPSATPPAAISITHSDGVVETDVPFETRSAEEVYDAYIAMSDDETIFEIIPRTEEGWDYFRAFMYKITDYKAAELFGPLDQETLQEMAALERRFLALEDLELTVDITRTDGTKFVHDGKPPAPAPVDASPSAEPSATP